MFRARQKGWLSRLFTKKPKPVLSKRQQREATLMTGATRRASLMLAFSAVAVAALLWMVLAVPPQISPEQLAAGIKAQRVRKLVVGPAGSGASHLIGRPGSNASDADEIAQKRKADPSHCSAVSFEMLSGFQFFVTDKMLEKLPDSLPGTNDCLAQIPDGIRALNEKCVSVRGFMLPMKYEGRLTTEFLLLRNQSLCCYGKPPRITEWVNVRVAGKGVKPIMDVPVTVSGAFHIGDVRENGELVGVYSLDAQKVQGP